MQNDQPESIPSLSPDVIVARQKSDFDAARKREKFSESVDVVFELVVGGATPFVK